jgi:hypothetical protein
VAAAREMALRAQADGQGNGLAGPGGCTECQASG